MTTPFPDAHSPSESVALHPWLLPVRPFLGVWRGRGEGRYPTLSEGFAFAWELSLSHDGRPFLHYTSRAWLLDGNGGALRPSGRESGWLRVGPDGYLEALLNHPTGISEIYTGRVTAGEGDEGAGAVIEMSSQEVARTPLAKEVTAGRRRYAHSGDGLSYAYDMAAMGQPLSPHLTAELTRVPDATDG
ncbi:FABP family protein [Streptomyces sp. AJS327]|uniref:FABP family protein n=1 Tax=Streptomyces sp. AJS327 TaxID=2545265 RepID=UPI0015DD8372|nr:FABP family protein [Streptomyces sp. AJS327]MBA0050969.1 FABP family protein [Streptomyces sp. AJS327]